MPKVLGLGGIFVKARQPEQLRAWYRDVLGIEVQEWGTVFVNDAGSHGVWNAFAADTKYFAPSEREFMINLRVDDVDGLLAQLRERCANVIDRREESEFGIFAYVVDPEGTLLELWQPPAQ